MADQLQTFAAQDPGQIGLDKGRQRVTIRAIQKPGDSVCDLKAISLQLLE